MEPAAKSTKTSYLTRKEAQEIDALLMGPEYGYTLEQVSSSGARDRDGRSAEDEAEKECVCVCYGDGGRAGGMIWCS